MYAIEPSMKCFFTIVKDNPWKIIFDSFRHKCNSWRRLHHSSSSNLWVLTIEMISIFFDCQKNSVNVFWSLFIFRIQIDLIVITNYWIKHKNWTSLKCHRTQSRGKKNASIFHLDTVLFVTWNGWNMKM